MKNLIFFILLLQTTLLNAQNYKWPEYTPVTVPAAFESEDAVYLQNFTTVDFLQQYETSVVYFKRIKILTKKGAEAFTERELYEFNDGKVAMKKVRVIKPSGEIKELGDEYIRETFIDNNRKREKFYLKRIQLLFPTVEPGDVIDLVYQIDYDKYLFSETFYLESDFASVNSRISLRNFSQFELQIFPTGEMADFTSQSGETPSFTWNKFNVSKESESFFSTNSPNAPSFTYTLWIPGEQLTYETFYKLDIEEHPRVSNGTGFSKQLINKSIITETDDYVTGLLKLIDYLRKNAIWVTHTKEYSKGSLIESFNNNEVNSTLFMRYVQQYLDEQKAPYEICFTRHLLNGAFIPEQVTFNQYEIRYLIVKDLNGNGHYLFQPNRNKYYLLDEIPYYSEGNKTVALIGDEHKLLEIKRMTLPESNQSDNRHTANILLKATFNSDSLAGKRTDIFTGHYAHILRDSANGENWLEDLAVSDTMIYPVEVAGVYPYQTTFKQENYYHKLLEPIDDTLVWFNPSQLLHKGLFVESETDGDAIPDYAILPFLKQDKISIYLEFDKPVNFAENSSVIQFSNDIGFVKAEVVKTNATTLKIIYEIKISNRWLNTKEKNEAFAKLHEEWEQYQKRKWVIALK